MEKRKIKNGVWEIPIGAKPGMRGNARFSCGQCPLQVFVNRIEGQQERDRYADQRDGNGTTPAASPELRVTSDIQRLDHLFLTIGTGAARARTTPT